METTIYLFVRLVAMHIITLMGLGPKSHCPLRSNNLSLYNLLSIWRSEPPKPTKPPMTLLSLPPEIILCISEQLNEKDLNALVRTTRGLASLLTPQLYDSVVGCRRTAIGTQDPNASPAFRSDALAYAGRWHSPYTINYFRTKRADVLLKRTSDSIVLFNRMARAGNAELVSILLQRGADINARSSRDMSALTYAAIHGHEHVVCMLLDAGADVDLFPSCRRTILHILYRYARVENPAVSQLLIDRLMVRGEISKKLHDNATPLHYAIKYNRAYAVPQLIKAGAELLTADNEGLTLLDLALKSGNTDIVQQLIEAYPGPWPSQYIQKLIWKSCDRLDLEKLQLIESLVTSRNVFPNISLGDENCAGLTALHVAARGLKTCSQASNQPSSSQTNCDENKRWQKVIDLVLEMGADIYATDRMGRTPLCYAVETGKAERIPFVLQKLDKTISIADNLGRTPLHAAVHNTKGELVVRHLLRAGADINAKDSLGQTPLHYAANSSATLPALEYLLTAGADASICDLKGVPAVHIAASQRRDGAIRAFVDAKTTLHEGCDFCEWRTMQFRNDNEAGQLLDLNDLFQTSEVTT